MEIVLKSELESTLSASCSALTNGASSTNAALVEALGKNVEAVGNVIIGLEKNQISIKEIESNEKIETDKLNAETKKNVITGVALSIASVLCACLEQSGQCWGKAAGKVLGDAFRVLARH